MTTNTTTTTTKAKVLTLLSAAAFLVYLGTAGSPPETVTPNGAAYPHYLRFKVLAVESVEESATQNLVQLRVQRWYGKIETHSHDLHKRYDTQELTFLFPSAPNAKIKVGDIIDYRFAAHITLDE